MTAQGYMTVDDIVREMSPARRKKVHAHVIDFCRQIETLRSIRKVANRSQVEIADALGFKQPTVSRLENKSDMYLSTLRRYVEAAGGTLNLVVEFPGQPPLALTGMGIATRRRARKPRRATVKHAA